MSTVVAKKSSFQAKKPDYTVRAQDPHNADRWFQIGAGWKGESREGTEVITVRLSSVPLDGKLKLMPPLPTDEGPPSEEVPF